MNLPLLSLRIQLALAKFRRYSNNGMDDRAHWDRRVGDLEYELASLSSPSVATALPRTFTGVAVFSSKARDERVADPITDMAS